MISTLREHSWIVLVFIACRWSAFLLMDAFNSNSGLVKNHRQTFAEIDGSEIPAQLDAKYSEVLTQYLTQTQQIAELPDRSLHLDNQTEFQLREQAWNDLLQNQHHEPSAGGSRVVCDRAGEDRIWSYDRIRTFHIKNYYSWTERQWKIWSCCPSTSISPSLKIRKSARTTLRVLKLIWFFLMRESLATRYTQIINIPICFVKADFVPKWTVDRDYSVKNTRVNPLIL